MSHWAVCVTVHKAPDFTWKLECEIETWSEIVLKVVLTVESKSLTLGLCVPRSLSFFTLVGGLVVS